MTENIQINVTWKRVLWWSFIAGAGFTVGAGLVAGLGVFLNGLFGLQYLGPWLAAGLG